MTSASLVHISALLSWLSQEGVAAMRSAKVRDLESAITSDEQIAHAEITVNQAQAVEVRDPLSRVEQETRALCYGSTTATPQGRPLILGVEI